jgi:DNA-binding IscR family transcriptional regulator
MRFSFKSTIAAHILLAIANFEGKEKATSTFLSDSVNMDRTFLRFHFARQSASVYFRIFL